MVKVHIQTKSKLHIFLLAFQNINMFAKGIYRIKIQSFAEEQKCRIQGGLPNNCSPEVGKNNYEKYLSKEFLVRFQNQKIQLNELVIIQTPTLKYSKENKIIVKVTLLKADNSKNSAPFTQYTPHRISFWIIRFMMNTLCQYTKCTFQQPFLSNLSALIFHQPLSISIEAKLYKNPDVQSLLQLKKQVKKMRYNSYLQVNKLKNILYTPFSVGFTLPKLFVSGEHEMDEVSSDEQHFLNYLLVYETINLKPNNMNYELTSICQKNEQLFKIFKQNCQKNTIYVNKLRMEAEQKQSKRAKLYVVKQQYKQRYLQQYKPILKEKLKLLAKEMEISSQDQILNNIAFKMDNIYQESKPNELPIYPIIIHQTYKTKPLPPPTDKQQDQQEQEQKTNKNKIIYILILAHGYQGCPEDLSMFANGFKKKHKKSKYMILKSYQHKMGQSIESMGDSAVQQINTYLQCLDFKSKNYRIVMLGHSMGGLILRLASNKMKYKQFLYAYVSLGTPHLGYLQGLKLHIRAGLSLFSNIYNNPCLDQLAGKDSEELHQTSIYKMSHTGQLTNFTKVILISSYRDKYVPWHSARLENYNKDILKQPTFIENEMINNILGKKAKGSKIERIDRLQIGFKITQNNVDTIIGRTCHIKLLTDLNFIDLLCSTCIPHIFNE